MEYLLEPLMNKFVKPRTENFSERIERLHHKYDDGPKPAHYDDKNIITMEQRAKLDAKKRPKKFDNNDPSTYPSNQKKTMSTWEAMIEIAKNPKDRDDRLQAGEIRKTILKNYRDPVMREHLGDDELKLIGKHKSQLAPKVTIKPTYVAPIPPTPKEPEVPIEEQIKKFADAEKQKRISNLRNTVGTGGIAEVYYKRFI
jgi:hypothetical protein